MNTLTDNVVKDCPAELIGQLLVAGKHIVELDLSKAIDIQDAVGGRVGSILIRIGALSEEILLETLSKQTGQKIVGIDVHLPDFHDLFMEMDASPIVFDWFLDQSVIFWKEDDRIICCTKDALPFIRDTMRYFFPENDIDFCLSVSQELDAVLDYLKKEKSVDELVSQGTDGRALRELAEEAPVIELVNNILAQAISTSSSDVHIEPEESEFVVRFRTDGILYTRFKQPAERFPAVASRIKLISGLDIAERRLPQDGRITTRISGSNMDIRVSTVPGVHGESIVMRVLDKSMMMIGIRQIGMTDQTLDRFMVHIRKPNGIVLVTGPTGCGKTTTLYAGLNEIKDPADKIITVEDPVEYRLDGILQININEGVGLTFARCLRSILRHDPDKVLVGEIRDIETAQIAVQASLTGHMVLSTLHTNSAASTITRLVDMGLEPFLLTSSLEAVIGQRLVRTICPKCRVPHTPTEEELKDFGVQAEELEDESFFRGQGCAECGHSGYHGRIGLYELLEVSDEMREMILDQASTDDIQALSKRNGMVTMREDGWMKIGLGLTTFEEVARDTPKDVAPDAPAEPRIEEVPQLEEPEVETPLELEGPVQEKAQAQLDSKQMMIEEEAAAHVEGVGDANPGGS